METKERQTLRSCNENYIGSLEYIADGVPLGFVERRGGVTIVRTGILAPGFNVVFALHRPESVEGLAERITKILVDVGVPWKLVTTVENSEYFKPVIEKLHLVHSISLPGLILDPIPEVRRDPPKELTIREVTEKVEVSTFVKTAAEGLGAPGMDTTLFEEPIYNLSDHNLRKGSSYLGYVNAKPVATSQRFSSGNVAGLYFVSVLPEYRRRGFGEAMTWRAVTDGLREGCDVAYLQSSDMGLPIYRRIGFRKLTDYEMWEIG